MDTGVSIIMAQGIVLAEALGVTTGPSVATSNASNAMSDTTRFRPIRRIEPVYTPSLPEGNSPYRIDLDVRRRPKRDERKLPEFKLNTVNAS